MDSLKNLLERNKDWAERMKDSEPDFFEKLAAAPPRGLGAVIKDAGSGRFLRGEELLAE